MPEMTLDEEAKLYALLDEIRRVSHEASLPSRLADRLADAADAIGAALCGSPIVSISDLVARADACLAEVGAWTATARDSA